jgi:CRP-like cAMP-binding protein
MPEKTAKSAALAMSLDGAWQLLERAGWLAGLDAGKRASLRAIARLRSCEIDEYLYLPGDQPDGVYGLVQGTLDILIPRLDGDEQLIHRAEAGFWIGDLALFAQQRRLVGVRATEPCTMVYLPQDQLKQVIRREPGLIGDFYKLTHSNIATALRLLGMLAIPRAENRVAIRLLMQNDAAPADDWIRLSQDCLADLVALSQQSVRRALRSLEERGLVEVGYGRLRILDPEKLATLCHYSTNPQDKPGERLNPPRRRDMP